MRGVNTPWVLYDEVMDVPIFSTVDQDEVLMLRMVNNGSILYYGLLRDGFGFKAVSGYGWYQRWYDNRQLLDEIAAAEVNGYTIDFGPVTFPVGEGVAANIRSGRFAAADVALLEAFHAAGAPNI